MYLQTPDKTDGRTDEYVANDGADDDDQECGADQDGFSQTVTLC